jgi:hypothetical protein
MSRIKDAIMDIQRKGWPVNNESLKKLVEERKTDRLEKEVFLYLDSLRDSGLTNMFGAAPYVEEEFELDKKRARALVMKWMKSYAKEGN